MCLVRPWRWPWNCRGYRSRRSSVLIRTVLARSSFVCSTPRSGVQYNAIQVVQKLTVSSMQGYDKNYNSFTLEFPVVPLVFTFRNLPFYPDAVFVCLHDFYNEQRLCLETAVTSRSLYGETPCVAMCSRT